MLFKLFMRFVAFVARWSVVMRYPMQVKLVFMVVPYFLIWIFNSKTGGWLAAISGGSFNIFMAGVCIAVFENYSGIGFYMERIGDPNFHHRLNALKIAFQAIVSIMVVYLFSMVNPLRILYPFGLPYDV